MVNYVRLVPYDKKKGALCRRLSVGGQLFIENRWYQIEESKANQLRELTQDTGCPFFEIIRDRKAWKAVVRRELAVSMAGPHAAALADLVAEAKTPVSSPPRKAGEAIQSKFAGMSAREVSENETFVMVARDVASNPEEEPAPKAKKTPSRPRVARRKPVKRPSRRASPKKSSQKKK